MIKYSNMALYKIRKLNVQTPPGLHHHRALYDCYITAALLIDIMNTSGWTAEQMADITGRPSLMTTFTFGKYRGKAVSDVAERDPGYLRWLFNNLDSMSPELRLTLKHYLKILNPLTERVMFPAPARPEKHIPSLRLRTI